MGKFDTIAKRALAAWPAVTPSLWEPVRRAGAWLRAQPVDATAKGPRLCSAGSTSLTTQPDGLWLGLCGDTFVDVVAVEACGVRQNFFDKRSRYMAGTTALTVEVSLDWLLAAAPIRGGGKRARWVAAGTFEEEPELDIRVPVRHLRVLYFLEDSLYEEWARSGVPEAHEFAAPMSSIRSYSSQKMQWFLSHMARQRNFYKRLPRRHR